MENFNSEQFAHLNPDTECAAFEQVSWCMPYNITHYSALRESREETAGRRNVRGGLQSALFSHGNHLRDEANEVSLFKCMYESIRLDQEDEGVPSTAIREVSLLKELHHPNIVRLLDVFCSLKKLYLIFEFVDNDLKKHMKTKGLLTPDQVKSFSYQLLLGMHYCHSNRIIHRDLKPQNLLINSQGILKIADFGLARAFSLPVPKYTHEVVTVWYRAPEILLGSQKYSIPIDNWSVGCILAEMSNNQPLFPGDSEIDTIFRIFRKLGSPNEQVWPGVSQLPDFKESFPKWKPRPWEQIAGLQAGLTEKGIDLMSSFLTYAPKDRLSCLRGLDHPYFDDLDKDQFKSE